MTNYTADTTFTKGTDLLPAEKVGAIVTDNLLLASLLKRSLPVPAMILALESAACRPDKATIEDLRRRPIAMLSFEITDKTRDEDHLPWILALPNAAISPWCPGECGWPTEEAYTAEAVSRWFTVALYHHVCSGEQDILAGLRKKAQAAGYRQA